MRKTRKTMKEKRVLKMKRLFSFIVESSRREGENCQCQRFKEE